ncbi:hypothetical protein BC941DRAFT_516434 [Chlamydoabsidia padenii]|nr:hypothetical protein BC941DRAFT_516434 [Chlamydoabsidia padenii]
MVSILNRITTCTLWKTLERPSTSSIGVLTRLYSTQKEIKFGSKGRASHGVDFLAKSVAVTLGPKGLKVLINQPYDSNKMTKDGITVAEAITLKNMFGNLRVRLVQDVGTKTKKMDDDGMTTAAGCNPLDLKRGGTLAVEGKRNRLEDALCATQEAIKEGIVPGSGVALLIAPKALDSLKGVNFDQQLGINSIRQAIQQPCPIIVENAGGDGSVVFGKLLEDHQDNPNWGYDAMCGESKDMVTGGIIDPTSVVKACIINASGITSLLTTSECGC